MHRGQRVGVEHLGDQFPPALQLRPGPAARLRVHQLREPPRHPGRPAHPVGDQTVTGTDPRRLSGGDVLADGLDIHPQAGRHHRLRAPGMPVLQDLHHIDHLKRPPRHPPRLMSSTDLERVPTGTADLPPTTPRPGAVIVGSVQVGNYVTVDSAEVRARAGRYPIIYTTRDWWASCTASTTSLAAADPLWVARYASSPGTLPAGWPTWRIWQYASSGRLPGDQDAFNGSVTQLRQFALGH